MVGDTAGHTGARGSCRWAVASGVYAPRRRWSSGARPVVRRHERTGVGRRKHRPASPWAGNDCRAGRHRPARHLFLHCPPRRFVSLFGVGERRPLHYCQSVIHRRPSASRECPAQRIPADQHHHRPGNRRYDLTETGRPGNPRGQCVLIPASSHHGRPPEASTTAGGRISLFQQAADASELTSVLAARSAVTTTATPLSAALGGPLVTLWGAADTLLYSGIATIMLAALVTASMLLLDKPCPRLRLSCSHVY